MGLICFNEAAATAVEGSRQCIESGWWLVQWANEWGSDPRSAFSQPKKHLGKGVSVSGKDVCVGGKCCLFRS